jgi:hypothetical protein
MTERDFASRPFDVLKHELALAWISPPIEALEQTLRKDFWR